MPGAGWGRGRQVSHHTAAADTCPSHHSSLTPFPAPWSVLGWCTNDWSLPLLLLDKVWVKRIYKAALSRKGLEVRDMNWPRSCPRGWRQQRVAGPGTGMMLYPSDPIVGSVTWEALHHGDHQNPLSWLQPQGRAILHQPVGAYRFLHKIQTKNHPSPTVPSSPQKPQ